MNAVALSHERKLARLDVRSALNVPTTHIKDVLGISGIDLMNMPTCLDQLLESPGREG